MMRSQVDFREKICYCSEVQKKKIIIESYAYLIGQMKTKLLGKHLWT